MDDNQKKELPKTVKQLAVSVLVYNAFSILGPLIGFGLGGYLLDRLFGTEPFLLIAGIIAAFILTNLLMVKRIKKMMKEFDRFDGGEKKKAEKAEGEDTDSGDEEDDDDDDDENDKQAK